MSCSSGRPPQHQVGPAVALQLDRLLEHLQRVRVDVLVLAVLVGGHRQRRQLGQDDRGQPGVDQQLEPGARCGTEQQLGQLGLHPLGRDPRQLAGHRRHRRGDLVGDLHLQLRDEPGRPQHPQRVVGEGLLGRRRGAQHAAGEVGQPAERVGERAVAGHRQRHRVHGEVAPDQVVDQRCPEGDLGIARHPVVAVGPEGRDLAALAVQLDADGAELDAGRPDRLVAAIEASSSRIRSGRASVVKSRSSCGRPISASRTEPPTRCSWWPAAAKSLAEARARPGGSRSDRPGPAPRSPSRSLCVFYRASSVRDATVRGYHQGHVSWRPELLWGRAGGPTTGETARESRRRSSRPSGPRDTVAPHRPSGRLAPRCSASTRPAPAAWSSTWPATSRTAP